MDTLSTSTEPRRRSGKLGYYGRAVRKLRIDQDMNLKQMAERVGLSSAFLSAIEKGDKPMPKGLLERVGDCLGIEPEQPEYLALEDAVMLDRGFVPIDLKGASDTAVEVAIQFAKKLPSLTEKQLAKVLSICTPSRNNPA